MQIMDKALELADELTVMLLASNIEAIKKAATMLREQQAEIEALKDEVAEWKMSYENCHRMCSGYGMN